jgi:hypothetical protein
MSSLRSRTPFKVTVPAGLLDLREQVLSRSTKRMPKWKFRLADDVVVMIQPKVGKQERVATRNGDAWEWIDFPRQFEGEILICDGADAAKLLKRPFGLLYCHQKFAIGADDAGGHRIVGTGFSSSTGLKDQQERETRWAELDRRSTDTLVAAFVNGTFDAIGPSVMLTPNCLYCGKPLTDPASMARGIGPECAGTGSVHAPQMKNLAGGEDEAAPVPRRPYKLVLLSEPDPDATRVEKVIRSFDDITLVPTQVRYTGGFDNEVRIKKELRAKLFEGREKATIVCPSAMTGHPIVTHCKILSAEIRGRPGGGNSPWWLSIRFVYAGKQKWMLIDRDFPTDALLVAWGHYKVDLTNLPSEDIHHHAWDVTMWAEVSRRFHAVVGHTAFIDTTKGAAAHARERRRSRQREVQA